MKFSRNIYHSPINSEMLWHNTNDMANFVPSCVQFVLYSCRNTIEFLEAIATSLYSWCPLSTRSRPALIVSLPWLETVKSAYCGWLHIEHYHVQKMHAPVLKDIIEASFIKLIFYAIILKRHIASSHKSTIWDKCLCISIYVAFYLLGIHLG